MNERPILFSAPMVRAILAGRKTKTRRVVKWQGPKGFPHDFERAFTDNPAGVQRLMVPYHHPDETYDEGCAHRHYSPYGDPGDRLWVRETGWERPARTPRMMREGADTWERFYYDADGLSEGDHEQFKACGFKRRPSIHMPRWASRITLEITGCRVERLQDISPEDAMAEGIEEFSSGFRDYEAEDDDHDWLKDPRDSFQSLWQSINGPGSWALNPLVWVVEFRRV